MLGKSQCNLWCLFIKGRNPLPCVWFQLNSSKEHKEKVLSVTKRSGNFIFSETLSSFSHLTVLAFLNDNRWINSGSTKVLESTYFAASRGCVSHLRWPQTHSCSCRRDLPVAMGELPWVWGCREHLLECRKHFLSLVLLHTAEWLQVWNN